MRRHIMLGLVGSASLLLVACSGGTPGEPGLSTEESSTAGAQATAVPSPDASIESDEASDSRVNAAFPPATFWAATDDSDEANPMSAVLENVVKFGRGSISLPTSQGEGCWQPDQESVAWAMDDSGGVHLGIGEEGSVLTWTRLDLPFPARDVAGGFGGLTVLGTDGIVQNIQLDGGNVLSLEPVVTTQAVTALASFDDEGWSESFALYEDGSVWWIDGYFFIPEVHRSALECDWDPLPTPQPFGVTGAERLVTSAEGDLVGAVLESGETVIWGREPGWGPAMGPITLTGGDPLTSIARYTGSTVDGELVEWSAAAMSSTNNGGSTPMIPIAGPSGVIAASSSGIFSDTLGQAWGVELLNNEPALVESLGPVSELAGPLGIEAGWLVGVNDGLLVGPPS